MSELLTAPCGSEKLKKARNPIRYKLSKIKHKCKIKGIEFNLKPEDITIPNICPLLGIRLIKYTDEGSENGSKEPGLWSVDRLDSKAGYTKENTWVISKRANTIKNDATLEELELLTSNLRNKLKAPGV